MEKTERKKATGLRDCTYDPSGDFITVNYEDGKPRKYLEVKFRVFWFQQYCAERGVFGVIDDSDISYDEKAQCARATASIFMDDKLVAKSSAAIAFVPGDPTTKSAMQTVATMAKGRALANAGFGTVNGMSEDGEPIPCDTGIPIEESNPFAEGGETPDVHAPVEKHRAESPANTGTPAQVSPSNPAQEPTTPLDFDSARAIVLPMGKHKGKTMGEVLALERNVIEFYASPNFTNPKYEQLKTAAQILIDTVK